MTIQQPPPKYTFWTIVLLLFVLIYVLSSCQSVSKLFQKHKERSDSTSVSKVDSLAKKAIDSTSVHSIDQSNNDQIIIDFNNDHNDWWKKDTAQNNVVSVDDEDSGIYVNPHDSMFNDTQIYIDPKYLRGNVSYDPDFDPGPMTIFHIKSRQSIKRIVFNHATATKTKDSTATKDYSTYSKAKTDSTHEKKEFKDVSKNKVVKNRIPWYVWLVGFLLLLALIAYGYYRYQRHKLTIPPL